MFLKNNNDKNTKKDRSQQANGHKLMFGKII